jgi:putative flippase GtrA
VKPANASATEMAKYLVTGGMNAVLTCIVYVAGLYVLHVHYLAALIAAFLVGVVFTYVVNFVWVFRPESTLSFRRRFVQYVASNAGTFIANLAALYYLVDVAGQDPFLSQVALMFVIVAANFLLAKHWSLRKASRDLS